MNGSTLRHALFGLPFVLPASDDMMAQQAEGEVHTPSVNDGAQSAELEGDFQIPRPSNAKISRARQYYPSRWAHQWEGQLYTIFNIVLRVVMQAIKLLQWIRSVYGVLRSVIAKSVMLVMDALWGSDRDARKQAGAVN
ncbi:hypothetical protein FRC07_014923 [Ceratobasidium sp. 392]|nr:hypothetical protein FRC07_014923 [Ceratobasidium sp. 392]